MKNISFALTTLQVYAQCKTVTRRFGWWNLKPETYLQGVVKGMGLRKGEKVQKIHVIYPTAVAPESLRKIVDFPAYGEAEMIKEGFPNMTPAQFVEMICDTHKGKTPDSIINRIAFEYLSPAPICGCGASEWEVDILNVVRCTSCFLPFEKSYPKLSDAVENWARSIGGAK